MAGRFSIDAVFRVKDKFTRPLAKMRSKMDRFTRSASIGMSQLNTAADRYIGGLKKIGIAAGAAAIAAGAAFKNIVDTGADFEQTLTNAAAKFPGQIRAGTEEFKRLRDAAANVGATTEFTASQAAEGLNFLAMAGMDATQSVSALPGVVDLATAAQVELGQATDMATDTLGAFGLATKDATQLGKNLSRVNDVIAKTTTSANTTVEDMFEAIKNGGPVATSAGASIETFSTLVGEMANAGIKGSKAGNTLKNVFVRLQAPAAAGASALKDLGVQTTDASGNMRDVVDILGDLNGAMEGMGSAERAANLDAIFGKRAIAGVSVLLQSGSKRLNEYRGEINKAAGASKDMADTMRNTTTGDLKTLQSAVEAVKIAIFEVVKGPLREVISSMTEWARANREVIASGIKDFVQGFVDNLPQIVKWGKRIGIIVGVFTAVAIAVKAVAAATALWNAVLAANPFTLIAMAIIAAIALIIAFWPEISAFFIRIWEGIKEVSERIGSAVGGFVESVWGPIKTFLTGAFEFVVGMLSIILMPVFGILRPVFAAFAAGAQFVKDNWGPISAFFSAIWEGIVAVFNFGKEAVMGVITENVERFKAAWSTLTDFWEGLWNGIVDVFWSIFGPIFDAIGSAVEKVQKLGKTTIGSFFLGGDDDAASGERTGGASDRQVVTPSDRVSRSIEERRDSVDINVRPDQGASASMSRKPRSPGIGLSLQPSGGI